MAYIDAWYASAALALTARARSLPGEAPEAGSGRLASVAGSSAGGAGSASALGRAETIPPSSASSADAAAANLQRWNPAAAPTIWLSRVRASVAGQRCLRCVRQPGGVE